MEDFDIRFANIHKQVRIEQKQSQEFMALELGVSKKTIQNWEKGVSSPTFLQSLRWFRALRINPLPYYMSIASPYKCEVSPKSSDDEIDIALNEVIKNLSPQSKRALLFLFMGKHGSSAYSVLQLTLAHLHLPIKERYIDACSVVWKYKIAKSLGETICNDDILPDIDTLDDAIDKAQESVLKREYGYNNL